MQGNISNARAEVHNLDVEALIAQFKEVSSVIADLPDLGSVDGDLRKLDKYLGDVAARQAQLHNASAVVDLVGRLISYSIPRAMAQLSVRKRGTVGVRRLLTVPIPAACITQSRPQCCRCGRVGGPGGSTSPDTVLGNCECYSTTRCHV